MAYGRKGIIAGFLVVFGVGVILPVAGHAFLESPTANGSVRVSLTVPAKSSIVVDPLLQQMALENGMYCITSNVMTEIRAVLMTKDKMKAKEELSHTDGCSIGIQTLNIRLNDGTEVASTKTIILEPA